MQHLSGSLPLSRPALSRGASATGVWPGGAPPLAFSRRDCGGAAGSLSPHSPAALQRHDTNGAAWDRRASQQRVLGGGVSTMAAKAATPRSEGTPPRLFTAWRWRQRRSRKAPPPFFHGATGLFAVLARCGGGHYLTARSRRRRRRRRLVGRGGALPISFFSNLTRKAHRSVPTYSKNPTYPIEVSDFQYKLCKNPNHEPCTCKGRKSVSDGTVCVLGEPWFELLANRFRLLLLLLSRKLF